ncbi:right-handed parallel beta-helix repeat-containing protein, partial [Bacteroidota bacterium]
MKNNNTKRLLFIFSVILFTVVALIACTKSISENKAIIKNDIAPKTIEVDISNYDKVIYVSSSTDDSKGNGSKEEPYSTITKAVSTAVEGELTAVLVAGGRYTEDDIKLKDGVSIFGGYDNTEWIRDIYRNKTEIAAEGKGRVIIAADNLTIDGFTITEGKYRGSGGAVYFISSSPTLSNNIFTTNLTQKPIPWNPKYWHETANDGGAVYFEDGANPIIENNIFMKNKTENGRGAGLACNNSKPIIRNNIFFDNIAGLDDPMRSSDGGAISIFDWCDAEITGNVILSNYALSSNDAGGIFVALWSSARIENNLFVDNQAADDAGALFVGGQEHRYDSPLDTIPSADKFYVS